MARKKAHSKHERTIRVITPLLPIHLYYCHLPRNPLHRTPIFIISKDMHA